MFLTKSKKYPNTLKISNCVGFTVLDVIELKSKHKTKYFSVFSCTNKNLVCELITSIQAFNIDEAYRNAKANIKLPVNHFIGIERIQ